MSLYTVRCHPLEIMYILVIYNQARQRFHTEREAGLEGKTVVTEPKPLGNRLRKAVDIVFRGAQVHDKHVIT